MNRDIVIERYTKDKRLLWNDFCKKSKNHIFMFEREYMDYHNDRFRDHSLIFKHKDKVVAVFPANEDKNIISTHGGLTYGGMVVGNDMRQDIMLSCFEALINYCKDEGVKEINYKTIPHIYHNQPSEEELYALYYFNGYIDKVEASTVVDLRNSIEMSKLRKRKIKKAESEHIEIFVDDSFGAYEEFMDIQNKVLLDRHNVYAAHSSKEIFMLHSNFPENIHLYAAMYNGEIIGGSIVFLYNEVVHTQYLCASEIAKNNGALDATIFKIMMDYGKQKHYLDFGISTENNGRMLNEGLIFQKEGFGGRTDVYVTWKLPIG